MEVGGWGDVVSMRSEGGMGYCYGWEGVGDVGRGNIVR